MKNRPIRTTAAVAIAAGMLILFFAANGAAQTPAESPRPALELGIGWQDLSSARSLLLGERLYHLSDGRLQSWTW